MVILGVFLFFFLDQQSYVCAISSSLREGSTLFVALSSTGVAALIHSTVPVFLIIAVKKNHRRFSNSSSVQVPTHPNQYSHLSWRNDLGVKTH